MSDLEQKEPGEYCNARKTDGSGYCKHEAGWGTDHSGVGRCKFHGGSTPDQEQGIINDLKDAADDGAVAVKLQLKRMRQKSEAGEEIDIADLNRLAKLVFDRTGHGSEENHNIDADVKHDLGDGWQFSDE